MKKTTSRLTLRGETIRVLAKVKLERVVGGWQSDDPKVCTVQGALPATAVTCPTATG
jgi:hypothetical protein